MTIDIYELAARFRQAIEVIRDKGFFEHDIRFNHFPNGSCGDTCYLLAEYLRGFGIETIWYSAERDDWSHAWLVIKDERIKAPIPRFFDAPDNIRRILNLYSGGQYDEPIDITRYEESDLRKGLIIDITGDQFEDYDYSVYVGSVDSFHKTFKFVQAHDYDGLSDERLNAVYKAIMDELVIE